MSHETFTAWWRRNRERFTRGHLTVEQARSEAASLSWTQVVGEGDLLPEMKNLSGSSLNGETEK